MKLVIRRRTDTQGMVTGFSVTELLVLTVLFLGAINFLNREIYCFFAAFAMLLFFKQRFTLSTKVFTVFLFSFVLLAFRSESQGTISTMVSTFVYPVCFVIGYCFTERQEGSARKSAAFLTLVVVLAMGNLLHLLLNVLSNIQSSNRNLFDFWTNSIRAATSQSALGVGAITVAIAALFTDTSKWKKAVVMVILLITLWCNLFLAGRTLLVIALVTLAAMMLFKFRVAPNARVRIVAWAMAAVALVALIYSTDLFGIKSMVVESNFYNRFFLDNSEEITETGRWDRKLEYLRYVLDHPFGGKHLYGLVGGYAHDLYLDTYDEGGIFALIMILVMEFQSIGTVWKLIKTDTISDYVKMVALCVVAGYHMLFFVEPIIAGMEWFLCNYILLYASMECLLKKKDD